MHKSKKPLGKTTEANIQSGVYFGVLGAVKELAQRIQAEAFSNEPVLIVATGAYANLFASEHFIDLNISDLVLQGLSVVYHKNKVARIQI